MTQWAAATRRLRRLSWAHSVYRWLKHQRQWFRFQAEFARFQALSRDRSRFILSWHDRQPCLDDRTETTGFDAHYLYHTAWAARCVAELRPPVHVDISSSLYFAALVSAFVPVRFYDYRPAPLRLQGLTSEHADLMHLPLEAGSIASLSCMHVVEHIGLGRYGDPLDPDGDLRAMAELERVLAPGGSLLFVTPVGQPKIKFNAHRIYAIRQILEAFAGLRLYRFALVTDRPDDGLLEDAELELANAQHYGCGCFWFHKTG